MSDSVTVGVRIRPLNDRELASNDNYLAWTATEQEITRRESKGKKGDQATRYPFHSFCYDSVFQQHSTNEMVYNDLAAPVVHAALGGFNATIFAYGQTSSGKTHSMLGSDADPGITPRAIRHVLQTVKDSRTRSYLVRAVYVEIYNDKIRDLLNPSAGDLAVREDKAGRVFVDAHEVLVESPQDAMAVLEKGQSARHVGETQMNSRSSRSHTVFTLQIESKAVEGLDASFRASSLNLVDLAGSERLKSTGAEGTRAKEGSHINQSLLVLGQIINKLSAAGTDASKLGHLPYRNSKLTRLLRPALGGNARLAVLCAMTPAAAHVEETISTLKFAERAKKVTTNATRNEVVDYRAKYKEASTEVTVLRERMAIIQKELNELRARPAKSKGASAAPSARQSSANLGEVVAADAAAGAARVGAPNLAEVVGALAASAAAGEVVVEVGAAEVEHTAVATTSTATAAAATATAATTVQTSPTTGGDVGVTDNASSSSLESEHAVDGRDEAVTATSSNLTTSSVSSDDKEDALKAADAETERAIKLRAALDEVKFLKAHMDEKQSENDHLRARLRIKGAEFNTLRERAVELRSAARKAQADKKKLQRTVRMTFVKLEEARRQLDVSRKKGSHVRLAETHLEELSEQLRRGLGTSSCAATKGAGATKAGIASSGSANASSSSAKVGSVKARRTSTLSDNGSVVAGPMPVRSGTTGGIGEFDRADVGRRGDMRGASGIRDGPGNDTMTSVVSHSSKASADSEILASAFSPRRRPRPLPEDMVADIDGSDTETVTTTLVDLDDLGVDDLEEGFEEVESLDGDIGSNNEAEEGGVTGKEGSARKKKDKKKPKDNRRTLKGFYGYAEDGVYDKMIGGHKVETV